MWGKILISLSFVALMNCTATTTCNPNYSNPGCSSDRVCDPTGICQLKCTTDTACTDPNTICDTSSSTLGLCQNVPTASGCPTGQVAWQLKSPAAGVNPVVCKQSCPTAGNTCAGASNSPYQFGCVTTDSSGSAGLFCWNPSIP